MSDEIKSGKEVIDDFFAEIPNVEGVDEKTIELLVDLYSDGKLTDNNIQNAMEELKLTELAPKKAKSDGQD